MNSIENYEIVFSRDSEQDGNPEVVVLVLDRNDLSQEGFVPSRVRLVEDPTFDFPKLIVDGAASATDPSTPLVECLSVPVDCIDALSRFEHLWVCVLNGSEIDCEFLVPFALEDRFPV